MAKPTLTDYRLSPSALRDLDAIWDYTAQRWSVAQAETYIRGLTADMDLLVREPRLARESHYVRPPVRLYRSGSHLIVYRTATSWLEILRIVHVRQNWASILNE